MWGARERGKERIRGRRREKRELESPWLFLLPSLQSFLSLHHISHFHPCLPGSSYPLCSLPNLYTKPPTPSLFTLYLHFHYFRSLFAPEGELGKQGGGWEWGGRGGCSVHFSFMYQRVLGRQKGGKSSKKSGAEELMGRQKKKEIFST